MQGVRHFSLWSNNNNAELLFLATSIRSIAIAPQVCCECRGQATPRGVTLIPHHSIMAVVACYMLSVLSNISAFTGISYIAALGRQDMKLPPL
ncbi:hypothetical protein FRB93_005752 [Tulasnella sp. JGI-2019a]|nr:hypothetical protein FRB93_005752 [Tulasnella sp. JGI-2019a]